MRIATDPGSARVQIPGHGAPQGDAPRRVLFITYEFPPSLEIGAHASFQLTRHLPLHGWEPVVLTVRERYFPNVDLELRAPFPGRIVRTRVLPHPLGMYAALKRVQRRRTNGRAAWKAPGASLEAVRQWILGFLTIPDVYTGWILPAVIAGLREIRRSRVDHICSSAPYWSNHLVALALVRLTGLAFTAHFRDPWIHGQQAKPVSAASERLERRLERAVVCRASSVICVTEAHTALLRRTYGRVPAKRFLTVPNGFDENEWDVLPPEQSSREGTDDHRFVILYAGTLYIRRDPLPVFRALRRLFDEGVLDRARVRFELIGRIESFEGRLFDELAREYGVGSCVRVAGSVARAESLRRMRRAGLLLLLAQAQDLQIPGKTYEYLRAGRPILALTTAEGATADLLRRTGGAWIVDSQDIAGIADAIRRAYRHWLGGDLVPVADPAVVESFDRRRLAGQLAHAFDSSLAGARVVVPAGVRLG